MTSSYSIHERVLLCSDCGSILTAPTHGGLVECPACRAPRRVAPRDDRPWAGGRSFAGSEQEYLARLRAMDATESLVPPPSLAHLLRGGQIDPHRTAEALELFRLTCTEVERTRSPEASERLYWLALMVSSHLLLTGEHRLRRAVLESALDFLLLRRRAQVLRCMLASSSAAEGDLRSAAAWIAPCDPFSGELEPDSALRVAGAFIATVQRDYATVLRLLGSKDEEVPIHDSRDAMAAVLRANALEKLGHEAAALEALTARMLRGGAGQRQAMETFARLHPALRLCERSLPIAAGRFRKTRARGTDLGSFIAGTTLLGVGLLLLGMAVETWASAALGGRLPETVSKTESLALLVGAVILLPAGWRLAAGAWRRRRIALRGLPGWGIVTSIERTGVSINDVPQVRIHLLVHRSGSPPHPATALALLDPATTSLAVGSELPVLVDPSAPQHAVVDA
ncbi:MAG TPA: hypothetical protein VIL20_06305 [Sandaracinaceae bacterium]